MESHLPNQMRWEEEEKWNENLISLIWMHIRACVRFHIRDQFLLNHKKGTLTACLPIHGGIVAVAKKRHIYFSKGKKKNVKGNWNCSGTLHCRWREWGQMKCISVALLSHLHSYSTTTTRRRPSDQWNTKASPIGVRAVTASINNDKEHGENLFAGFANESPNVNRNQHLHSSTI